MIMRLFRGHTLARVACWYLLVASFLRDLGLTIFPILQSVMLLYNILLAISALLTFGHFAATSTSSPGGRFAGLVAWILSLGSVPWALIEPWPYSSFTSIVPLNGHLVFIPPIVWGVFLVTFGISLATAKRVNGKTVVPIAIGAMLVGLANLSVFGQLVVVAPFDLYFYVMLLLYFIRIQDAPANRKLAGGHSDNPTGNVQASSEPS